MKLFNLYLGYSVMALQGQQSEKKKHKTYTDLQTSSSYSQQPIIESPN